VVTSITTRRSRRDKTVHQLAPKVSVSESNAIVLADQEQQGIWYNKVRLMRRDPTIALVRMLIVSGPLAAGWSVESKKNAPAGALDLIKEELNPIRFLLIKSALLGCTDFGWQPFEKVFKIREDGLIGIQKLKPLVQDETEIRVIKKSGAFNGFYQRHIDEFEEVNLSRKFSLLYNFDVEGTNWYGSATMRNVESPYDRGEILNESSERFDEKIAGAHWKIEYPIGSSEYNGVDTDNFEIANVIKSQLQSNSILIIPQEMERFVDNLNGARTGNPWNIDIITADSTAGVVLVDKAKYYDMLKVRGLGFPERSITEGRHGTKAEASEHADFALSNVKLRHDEVILATNLHLVNQMLVENYGPGTEGTVFLKSNELTDAKKRVLRELYMKVLTQPELVKQEVHNIDFDVLREILGIPENTSPPGFEEFEKPVPVQMIGINEDEGEDDEGEDEDEDDNASNSVGTVKPG